MKVREFDEDNKEGKKIDKRCAKEGRARKRKKKEDSERSIMLL